jgi:hypothetical protein
VLIGRNQLLSLYEKFWDRAVAQAVSRRLRALVRSCGICGGQSCTGAGYLRVLRFPLPILHHPSGAGTEGRRLADVPSGLSPQPKSNSKLHVVNCL